MSANADDLALARAYHRAGQLQAAEPLYRRVLGADPGHAEASYLLGALCQASGRPDEAVTHLQQAVLLGPGHAEAHNHLGTALAGQGRLDEAVSSFEQALRLRPEFAEARGNLRHALATRHNDRGIERAGQGRLDEAIACYRQALELNPNLARAHCNLGAALHQRGDWDEAEAASRRALELHPSYAKAHCNLGGVFHDRGEWDRAEACFRRAVEVEPEFAGGHYNLALARLFRGDFEGGWAEYDWRWGIGQAPFFPRAFRQPAWDGHPLAGATILLHAEQGLGDAIQFVRYAPLVRERGGRVVLECHAPLLRLLAGCPGVDLLVGRGDELPSFDVHAPLLSLPRAFATTLETIPAAVPYLAAEPALVRRWRAELAPLGGFRVGVSWQGNPAYPNDRRRSIPLAQFAPLARVPGVRLIGLQKGAGAAQAAGARDLFPIVDLSGTLDEASGPFMDSAAIMASLDLVVTSDTAIAHLAGALGVPVWVALPSVPDWRWLLDRDDSPWYPSMRLFRQRTAGDWPGVFESMAAALRARLEAPARDDRGGDGLG